MLLFKFLRWTRVISSWFFGNKYEQETFRLFGVDSSEEKLYKRLIPHCYQYNYMGATYRNQIFRVRKLMDLEHQIHLRFYTNGWVTGHYELCPEYDIIAHIKGVDLRTLTIDEINSVRAILQ